MNIRIVLGFVPPFFTSKYSFSSGVGYVMRAILIILWTAFQSFIPPDNNNNHHHHHHHHHNHNNHNHKNDKYFLKFLIF